MTLAGHPGVYNVTAARQAHNLEEMDPAPFTITRLLWWLAVVRYLGVPYLWCARGQTHGGMRIFENRCNCHGDLGYWEGFYLHCRVLAVLSYGLVV